MSLTALRAGTAQPLAPDTDTVDRIDVIDSVTGSRVGGIHPTAGEATEPLAVICCLCWTHRNRDNSAECLAWLEQHRKDKHL